MTTQVDPGLQSVIDNIQVIAASEGGSIRFIDSRGGKLTIEYTPGVNEECPECVPTHDLIEMMVKSSAGILAPYISESREFGHGVMHENALAVCDSQADDAGTRKAAPEFGRGATHPSELPREYPDQTVLSETQVETVGL